MTKLIYVIPTSRDPIMQGYSPVTLQRILLNRLLRKGSDLAYPAIPSTVARELTLVRPVIGRYRVATSELLTSEREGMAVGGAERDRQAAYWNTRVGELEEVKLREGTAIGNHITFFHFSYFEAGVLYTEGYSQGKVTLPGGKEREVEMRVKENFRLDPAGRLENRITFEVHRVVGDRVVTDKTSVMRMGDRV